MRNAVLCGVSASLLALWSVGCDGVQGTSSTTSSSTTGGETFTIAPTMADVATCRIQTFTAMASDGVTWSVEGGGSIADGNYTAPISVPSPATATITAKRDGATATADITLATAFPEPGVDVGRVAGDITPEHVRPVAARGMRAYALVERDANNNKNQLSLARSDDGGLTWGAPTALPAGVHSPAVAIDAGDDDTVYVTLKTLDQGQGANLDLAVSTDGGKSFTTHTLFVGGDNEADDADVVSPSPGHVVVTAPATYINTTSGDQGMMLLTWADAKKGAAFGPVEPLGNGYDAKWSPGFSMTLPNGRLIETDSSRGGPMFATNGGGALCLVTNDYDINGSGESHYVMCSPDQGKTWDAPVTIASGLPVTLLRSRIAMGKDGKTVAVAWNTFADDVDIIGKTQYAVSLDGGKTFDIDNGLAAIENAGVAVGVNDVEVMIDDQDVIWFARNVNDLQARVQVDKSCDKGKTLSGAFDLPVKDPYVNPFFFVSGAGIFSGAVRHGTSDVGLTAVRLLTSL